MIAHIWTATVIQMWAVLTLAAVWAVFWPAGAASAAKAADEDTPVRPVNSLIIIEASPGFNPSLAKAEFVELVNVGEEPIGLVGWQLRKLPSTSSKGSLYLDLGKVIDEPDAAIKPGQRLMLVSDTISPSDPRAFLYTPSLGISADKGTLRLVNPQGQPVDELSWQKPSEIFNPCPETPTAGQTVPPLHPSGKSFKRQLNADGQWLDSGLSEKDFCLSDKPTSNLLPPVDTAAPKPETPPADPPAEEEPRPGSGGNATYAPLGLSELLPDPVSPQTDEEHEYVEIYNATAETVNLSGYSVETGSQWRYKYVFADGAQILPGGYALVSSSGSSIRLVNDGSAVRLLDPSGKVIDETAYPAAKAGQSWSRSSSGQGEWQWSLVPTPGLANIIQQPPPAAPAPAAAATAKKTTVAKKTAAQPKAAAAAKAKPKTSVAAPAVVQPAALAAPPASQQLNWTILGSVAGLVAAYGAFEFRREIGSFGRRVIDKLSAGRR